MAIKGCTSKIFIDENHVSTQSAGFSLTFNTSIIEYNVLQTCNTLKLPDQPSLMIDHSGFYSQHAAGYLSKEFYDYILTNGGYITVQQGSTAPQVGVVLTDSFNANFVTSSQLANLIAVNGKWTGNVFYAGLFVADQQTITATGGTTEYDFGAAGTTGGVAFLLVHSISGTATNATVVVESSGTSGSGYATEGTFTFSAVGVVAIALSGTVNRYIRLNTTALGGATNFNVSSVVCVKGVNY